MKKRVLSGIRSTGQLHLGNYFGALRNFVKLQDEAECYFFIADYHSLTTHPDPTILHSNVRNILSEYLAAGIDPEKATIYVQSDVPEVAELSLLLGMHAYVGELERTASFKDKVRKNPNNVNIGLLNYPVLMASDILRSTSWEKYKESAYSKSAEVWMHLFMMCSYMGSGVFPISRSSSVMISKLFFSMSAGLTSLKAIFTLLSNLRSRRSYPCPAPS